MRIAILGNSGSGKSSLAAQLMARHGLDALDLDTVAWEPGQIAVARDPEEARADVLAFCGARDSWVVEGCYARLVEAALELSPTLLFMDPGVEACLANCRARPWEPHKYPSKAEQDEKLEFLLSWVRDYDTRAEEPSLAAHAALFGRYNGPKLRLSERPAPDFEPPMTRPLPFNFNDDGVAGAYDDVLVPLLFSPWADRLIEAHQPWEGRRVLDLATGTGAVARLLAREVGPSGSVLCVDLNSEMLTRARAHCAGSPGTVQFLQGSAEELNCPDDSIDFLTCQQGFQFFPNKDAAAGEMHRVLRAGGRAFVSTWRPVAECGYMAAICAALEGIGELDLAQMIRVPFDFMPTDELAAHFHGAGFAEVSVEQQSQCLVLSGGTAQGVELAYATPIGPKLRALSEEKQAGFTEGLTGLLAGLSTDGVTMGMMVSDVLVATKRRELP